MLTSGQIRTLFRALDEELAARGVVGEVLLCGGAVMCLVFEARKATKDVDAAFQPTEEVRAAARTVAERLGVEDDWLNDAAKGFFGAAPPRQAVLELVNLRVWAPTAEYMLAMKSVSARFDSQDRDDVRFLLSHLGIDAPTEAFDLIARYYPRAAIPAKAQFLLEELLGSGADEPTEQA